MDTKSMIIEIEEMVENIVNYDMECNKKHKSYSVIFEGIQRPRYKFCEVVEVDSSGMVILQFDDTLGTTDALPLSIFNSELITTIYNQIYSMNGEIEYEKKMKKCEHILFVRKDDDDFSVIGVYEDFVDCKKALKHKIDEILSDFPRIISADRSEDGTYHYLKTHNSEITYWIESYPLIKKSQK